MPKCKGEVTQTSYWTGAKRRTEQPRSIVELREEKKRRLRFHGADNKTSERRNYFAELAIWSERHIGILIIEAKTTGVIGNCRPSKDKPDTLSALLGTASDTEAQKLSSRSQALAERVVDLE